MGANGGAAVPVVRRGVLVSEEPDDDAAISPRQARKRITVKVTGSRAGYARTTKTSAPTGNVSSPARTGTASTSNPDDMDSTPRRSSSVTVRMVIARGKNNADLRDTAGRSVRRYRPQMDFDAGK